MPETPPLLPCGCQVGYRLCPEAERLWRLVGARYEAATVIGHRAIWEDYDRLRAAYEAHVTGRDGANDD